MRRLLLILAVFTLVSLPIFSSASKNENGIVEKLINIFQGFSEKQIDIAIERTKQRLAVKINSARLKEFEELFDTQIATLKDRGVYVEILEILRRQKGVVLAKASEMAIGDGNIPFIPVLPRSFRNSHSLMAMVRNGGKVGYTDFNPTLISDVVDAPQEPYYIYDVEDGSSTLGESPENAENILKSLKRSPLTAAEIIALAVHTDVLSRHNVWATGSRYGTAVLVPYVSLAGGDRPELDWLYVDTSAGRWGTASRLR